ncbi:hypothetical protein G6F59_014448 [Rhizopus arrhizus]|nr:hypothetical protein G6F59_014448 [Rhizopus arrhizus]
MADVLVDGQEQFLACVAGSGDGVLDRIVGIAVGGDATGQLDLAARIAIEELVAHAHRRGQAGAGAEFAAGLVDGGGGERQPDAMDVLVDERAIAGGESAPAFSAAELSASSSSTLSWIGTSMALRRIGVCQRTSPTDGVGASCTGRVWMLALGRAIAAACSTAARTAAAVC